MESRKELDAFVELDPVAEITEVGTKEVLPDTPQPEPRSHSHTRSQNHNRFQTQSALMFQKGPVAIATPQASLEVKAVRQEGIDAVVKEVEKETQTPAVSAAPVSEGRLPNTGTEESVASLVAGILAAGLASAVLDDQKKSQKAN